MHLRCMLGLHRRSRGRARHNGDFVESGCKYCGRPMWRDAQRKWRLNPPSIHADSQSSTGTSS